MFGVCAWHIFSWGRRIGVHAMLCGKFFNRARGNELHALYAGEVERRYWPGIGVRQLLRRRDRQRQRGHRVYGMCGGYIYQSKHVRRLRSWILLLSR